MKSLIQPLVDQHRAIEAELERLGLAGRVVDLETFRSARDLCIRHFEREEEFLFRRGARDTALAFKLRAQHDEALELAFRAEEAMTAGQDADSIYMLRRFLAIAEHNIIEEERDVFPLYSG
jgi:hypothetical protein